MAGESHESVKAVEDRKVPQDLLQKLHDANQRFHQAKQNLETVMADSGYRHQERIQHAADEVNKAELEMEQVTQDIHGTLKPPPGPPGVNPGQ